MLKKLKTLIYDTEIKAVIFDYDGVLNNSLHSIRAVWNEFYNQRLSTTYFETDKEFSNYFQGDTKKNITDAGVAEEDVPKCQNIIREFLPGFDKEAELYLGTDSLIRELKKKDFKIGIVSNSLKPMIEDKLKKYSIEDYVDLIIGYDEVDNLKPDPEGIKKCMKELKVKPRQTIYVGDMKSDVDASKIAKVKFMIATTYGYLRFSDNMLEQLKDADILVHGAGHLYIKIMQASKKW